MEKREVPSGMTPWPWVPRMAVHRLVLRERHDGHCRHLRRIEQGQRGHPFQRRLTPAPDIHHDARAFRAQDQKGSLRSAPEQRRTHRCGKMPVALDLHQSPRRRPWAAERYRHHASSGFPLRMPPPRARPSMFSPRSRFVLAQRSRHKKSASTRSADATPARASMQARPSPRPRRKPPAECQAFGCAVRSGCRNPGDFRPCGCSPMPASSSPRR